MSTKPESILYTAEATATGGRAGHAATSDGRLAVDLSMQAELGGPADGKGTNPEQMFAAGYAACFGSSIEVVARRAKVHLTEVEVTARVGIGPNSDGGFGLAAELMVRLAGVDAAQAETLVDAAHLVCPYSNATRGNIDVRLSVVQ